MTAQSDGPQAVTKVKMDLEAVGRRWHRVAKHPGPYGECNEKTCYHTHSMVSR